MADTDYSWAKPVMQAGYAGRGLVYTAVAGISLWGIWQGGGAQGTGSALASLTDSPWGVAVLVLIAIGLLAYMVWRVIDGAKDLEDEGTDAKGTIARIGQIITGLIHGGLGVFTILLLTGDKSGGGNGIVEYTRMVLEWPGGRFLIGFGALCTIGAGLYYLKKAVKEDYRDDLAANHFTVNWNWALKAGVAAQGVIVTIIGGFFLYAALRSDASEAGGLAGVFEWLYGQPFGWFLVLAMCIGLLGFALFCFVNAAYRIIPKIKGSDDIETLGSRLKSKVEAHT